MKQRQRDQRRQSLHAAATRLLADRDYDQVGVAEIAREAGISVGAFYGRFKSKDEFLGSLIRQRLWSAKDRASRELDPVNWRMRVPASIVRGIVEHVSRELHGPGAGVIRAALKRGHADRTTLEPLLAYRRALGERATTLLARHTRVNNRVPVVQAVMQIIEATALDALLHEDGPLRPGGRRMVNTLTAMMLAMLELSGRQPVGIESEDDGPTAGADDEDMIEMPIEHVVAIPLPAQRHDEHLNKPVRRSVTQEAGRSARRDQKDAARVGHKEVPRPRRRRYL